VAAQPSTVIVPTLLGGERLERMLGSLVAQSVEHETIVVDNGSPPGSVSLPPDLERGQVLRLERNLGYTRAINLAAERAAGEVIVLLNDDCVVDPRFVELISAPIDAAAGVAMAAGVMRDWRHPSLIDSAGMELDRTLLVFDYLNGEPLTVLDAPVEDPIGPSGAAAAFDRATYLAAGGFDEQLFAYYEDVELVLRLRREGIRCALAPGARGDHEHSITLGSGSSRKNYLMGFGRGYVLRKFGVVGVRRLGPVLARDGTLCAGQAIVDRNLSGLRGRVQGYRHARPSQPYPEDLPPARGDRAASTLFRRAKRRLLLRSPALASDGGPCAGPAAIDGSLARAQAESGSEAGAVAVFHVGGTSGPLRSLEAELGWLAAQGPLSVVVPTLGPVSDRLGGVAEIRVLAYQALTQPSRTPIGLLRDLLRMRTEVRRFRGLIRTLRPGLLIAVTSMVPAAALAAKLERIPVLVYCGELYDRGFRAGPVRRVSGRLLALVTRWLADAIAPCSRIVADQFTGFDQTAIELLYPPVDDRYARGDRAAFRARHGIGREAPCVASVGNLTEGRGQDLLIRAAPAILASVPDARILVAGDPFPRPQDLAYRESLVELIEALGLVGSVLLVGHVEGVADLYAGADVIVNPARFNEPFGRVPFEAAIAGRPSVVTRVGAIPELLRDGVSALIVPRDDPLALAEAVIKALADAELRTSLARAAAEIAAARLTPAQSLAGFQRAVATARSARRWPANDAADRA